MLGRLICQEFATDLHTHTIYMPSKSMAEFFLHAMKKICAVLDLLKRENHLVRTLGFPTPPQNSIVMLSITIGCIQYINLWATDCKPQCGLGFCLSLLQETSLPAWKTCCSQPQATVGSIPPFHLWAWKEETSTFQFQLLLPRCQKFVACSSLWGVRERARMTTLDFGISSFFEPDFSVTELQLVKS